MIVFSNGFILGKGNIATQLITLTTKLNLSGPLGKGDQYWSWISIEDVINNYEPRVTINTVRVDPFEEKNLYNIIIVYSIVNDPNPVNIQELDFFLERTR